MNVTYFSVGRLICYTNAAGETRRMYEAGSATEARRLAEWWNRRGGCETCKRTFEPTPAMAELCKECKQ